MLKWILFYNERGQPLFYFCMGGLGDFTSPLSKQTIMHIQVYNVQARKTVNFIFLLFS